MCRLLITSPPNGRHKCELLFFCILLSLQIDRKANLPLALDVQTLKGFQLHGLCTSEFLTRGSSPGPSCGLYPETYIIVLQFALMMDPPLFSILCGLWLNISLFGMGIQLGSSNTPPLIYHLTPPLIFCVIQSPAHETPSCQLYSCKQRYGIGTAHCKWDIILFVI